MDSEYGLDFHEVEHIFETAEVLAVYFPLLARTLVVDFRQAPDSPPLVKVMPMVRSEEERYRSIRRLRPQLGKPETVTFVPWPKYVEGLVRLGIWDRLVGRLVQGGYRESVASAAEAIAELREIEHSTVHAAISGKGFRTIWTRFG